MENPEHNYHTIDTLTMYKYDHHTNIPWNITQYKTPSEYLDPDLEAKKRKWASQKKGIKDTRYVTKRGFYMDYELKVAKGIPSSNHQEQKQWDFQKLKKMGDRNKIDPKLSKYSFLDRIQMEQKNRKSPGVCAYSLEKSIKEKDLDAEKLKKRKYNIGEKIFFYQNTQRLSDGVPGVGNYCPHLLSPKIRENKTDHKLWIDKHKKQSEVYLKREMARPTAGTYNPMNTTISTFDQLVRLTGKSSKIKGFGADARFEYTRQVKKKILQKRPDPSSHSTIIEWKGKGISPKKQSWNQMVWKGHTSSIYH